MKSFNFYLKASNYFLNIGNSSKLHKNEREYNYISAVLLAWVSLEAYVNAICESFSKGTRLNLNLCAFLKEYTFDVDDEGNIIKRTIRPSTTKKILFLLQNFSNKNTKKFKQTSLWRDIQNFEELRNRILHYKEEKDIHVDFKKAKKCRDVTKDAIEFFNKAFK